MSIMYLAKVNLNSTIYEVYDNRLTINSVLDKVLQELSDEHTYTEDKTEEFTDSLGNKKKYTKTSIYKFNELKKDNDDKIITGKLVRSFKRLTEKIDPITGTLGEAYTDESVSIYFYFDVRNELITFSIRQLFGYNQFTNAFNQLLNLSMSEYGFEVFLQKDEEVLNDKLKTFRSVKKVTATLIPPNANEEELEDLRTSLGYIQDCKDANAKKYKLELIDSAQESALNMEAKVMQDIIKAVSKGYGDMSAYGISQTGREQIIKSNQDAALTCVINENITEEEYNSESKAFILRYTTKTTIGRIIHD